MLSRYESKKGGKIRGDDGYQGSYDEKEMRGGGGGIRTPDILADKPAFQASAIGH